MDVSKNGGFPQQPWVFLLKITILGCEMGVPPFKETPKWTAPTRNKTFLRAGALQGHKP